MPEREFIGKCPDCKQQTETPLLVTWKHNFLKKMLPSDGIDTEFASDMDINSPLVEWLIAHYVDAPAGYCNMVRLINPENENYDCGFIEVIRMEVFYKSQNKKDIVIAKFKIY